jgi:hypothetical protein
MLSCRNRPVIFDLGSSSTFTCSNCSSSTRNASDSDEEVDRKKDVADKEKEKRKIIDQTETDLVRFRTKICSVIRSSINAEECAYKICRIKLCSEQEVCLLSMKKQEYFYLDF